MHKIRKTMLIPVMLLLMTTLCGCDLFASINLTKEQSGLIAEYAAGLLRKYDTHTRLKEIAEENGVVDTASEELPEEVAAEPAVEETIPEEPAPEEYIPVEDPNAVEPDFFDITEGMDVVDASDEDVLPESEEQAVGASEISRILGVGDFDISYIGYDLCDKYPENEDNSWLMSMAADDGKKLCVLKFAITNNSGGAAVCDILNSGKSYRLIVNDEKRINETVTVLMDSFSQFNESINSGESKEAVLVFEPETELADSIKSLKLIIKDPDNSDTIELE